MIEALIRHCLAHRGLVLAAAVLLAAGSLISVRGLTLDAIPDLSDPQVVLRASWPGQSPAVVEEQLTYALTSRLRSVPRARAVRAWSMYGDAFVYVLFEDGTDPYWARSRVLEQLAQVQGQLPQGARVELGPDATGVGWVYQYALLDRSGNHDLADLRRLQDGWLRYELQRLPGVAEVAAIGGHVRQFEAVIDPLRLQHHGLEYDGLIAAVTASHAERSGGRLWLVWALGHATSVAVAVGFIALAGVAAEFGVVMLITLHSAVQAALRDTLGANAAVRRAAVDAALVEGALRRLRPKLMTVTTLFAGLTPMLFGDGVGAATLERIAAPMVGGMLSAPLLSLLVLPAGYRLLVHWRLRHAPEETSA